MARKKVDILKEYHEKKPDNLKEFLSEIFEEYGESSIPTNELHAVIIMQVDRIMQKIETIEEFIWPNP